MHDEDEEIHRTKTEARAGSKDSPVSYVLVISLVLVIIAFVAIVLI